MPWEPEKFSREQRKAAVSTLIQAQNAIWRQDRSEFGVAHAEAVHRAYLRVDDLLSAFHEAIYAEGEAEDYPPPSAR